MDSQAQASSYTSLVQDKKYLTGEFELWEALTTHDARRTFASIAYQEMHFSLDQVREHMKHADTKQTLKYIGAVDTAVDTLGMWD